MLFTGLSSPANQSIQTGQGEGSHHTGVKTNQGDTSPRVQVKVRQVCLAPVIGQQRQGTLVLYQLDTN